MKNSFHKSPPFLLLIAIIILSSCNRDSDMPSATVENNLLEIASSNPGFSTLVAALNQSGLADPLSQRGTYTMFAPTDEAFDSFLEENDMTAYDLLASPILEKTLTYHVLSSTLSSENVKAGGITSLSEENFYISEDPTGRLWINGSSEIIQTDIVGGNGVLHIIDHVITPPQQSIAEIAVASTETEVPEFTQLTASLIRTEMLELLSSTEHSFTLFAPTDAAFEDFYRSLGVTGVDNIPVETLKDILQLHLLTGRSFFQDFRDKDRLPTLSEGQFLTVDLASRQVNGSDLKLTASNIHATNGVIHTIDSVILPE